MGGEAENTARRDALSLCLSAYQLARTCDDVLKNAITNHPGVACLKEHCPNRSAFIMLAFSRRYAIEMVGGNSASYIGKTDFEFWPAEEAAIFYDRDESVRQQMLRGGDSAFLSFSHDLRSPVTRKQGKFSGYKYGIEDHGRTFIIMLGDIDYAPS